MTYDDTIKDKEMLEKLMISYLETFRVTDKDSNEKIRPKAMYFDMLFSHLKQGLATETDFDYNNRTLFAELYKAVVKIKKQIMIDGRGKFSHILSDGLKKPTVQKRQKVMDRFKKYVSEDCNEVYDNVIKNKKKLIKLLLSYLETIRVKDKKTNEQIRPKMLYLDAIISHLKGGLREETSFDFTNRIAFSELYKGIKKIKQDIKRDGRGRTSVRPEIPQDTLKAIFELLSCIQALMKSRIEQNQTQYEIDLMKIPKKYM